MDGKEEKSSKYHCGPPWFFRGRKVHTSFNLYYSFTTNYHCCCCCEIKCGLTYFSALYQLHLVKAETARAFIPKEFRLVEAFG